MEIRLEVLARRNWSHDWIVFFIGKVRYERRTMIRNFGGDTAALFENNAGCELFIHWESGRWKQQADLGRETKREVEILLNRLFVLGMLNGLEPQKVRKAP